MMEDMSSRALMAEHPAQPPPDWHTVDLRELEETLNTSVDTGLDRETIRAILKSNTQYRIPSPISCPSWLCCLLPCLKNTKAMKAYRQLLPRTNSVIRDGKTVVINSSGVLPGDILRLHVNDTVPADARVLFCSPEAEVDTSTLFSSTMPVKRVNARPMERDEQLERVIGWLVGRLQPSRAAAVNPPPGDS